MSMVWIWNDIDNGDDGDDNEIKRRLDEWPIGLWIEIARSYKIWRWMLIVVWNPKETCLSIDLRWFPVNSIGPRSYNWMWWSADVFCFCRSSFSKTKLPKSKTRSIQCVRLWMDFTLKCESFTFIHNRKPIHHKRIQIHKLLMRSD